MAYPTMAPVKGVFGTLKVDGKDVPTISQEKLADCGPSCIGLVLRLTGHADAASSTPASLRAASQESGAGGYRPAVQDAIRFEPNQQQMALAGMMQAVAQSKGTHSPGDGTFSNNLSKTLRDRFGYKNAKDAKSGSIKSVLHDASFKKPFIVHVTWEAGGGHWVVCCGYKHNFGSTGDYLITDPYFGAGVINLRTEKTGGSKQASYVPAAGQKGHLSGWYISI